MDENQISRHIVDAAIAVHRELGPGLLEIVYEVVLLDELRNRGLKADRQIPIPIVCRGKRFDEGFRADIIVENSFISSTGRVAGAAIHPQILLTRLFY